MKLFRDFFFYTRNQRRGILLLVAAIVAVWTVNWWLRPAERSFPQTDAAYMDSLITNYKDFLASVKYQDSIQEQRFKPQDRPAHRPDPRPFDPNEADSALLCRIGLPGWMARNVVRYRQKGGVFRKPEDFRRIYGMTDERFEMLRPYIRIARQDTATTPATADKIQPDTTRKDSTRKPAIPLFQHVRKYPAGTIIELNQADTTELKKIPGVGSVIARMIVKYRTRLGGYYSVSQLKDIRLRADLLEPWFRVDTTAIRRINLNRGGTASLRRHPYINFYQARAIVEWRKEHGPLKDLTPFEQHPDFTKEDLERLGHYVCYE
ncbi:helix-hairpin-helix domain-containing protein [uncultured Bacteroides sp.]|uniref:helix-hairpin-helix domain-containing protein n=1 Tax=uncultured Bacteroides sp. TaxID=162156 RepID=UPI00262F60FF|nr:helix-hairpin-helix domain-containing protein [uncultured Bacteroides sp.]